MNKSSDESVLLLLDPLKNRYGSYSRVPKGFHQSWHTVQQAREDSTARIFLDAGGFLAWVTYVVAKTHAEGPRHFPGKARVAQLITKLETETIESRKKLAEQLALCINGELRTHITHWQDNITLPRNDSMTLLNKRRRMYFTINCNGLSNINKA